MSYKRIILACAFVALFSINFSFKVPVAQAQTQSCISIPNNLRQGMRDGVYTNYVYQLQTFLINRRLLSSDPTGYFGTLTKAAVQSYQQYKGLPTTGFVGSMTRNQMALDTCTVNPGTQTPINPITPVNPVNPPSNSNVNQVFQLNLRNSRTESGYLQHDYNVYNTYSQLESYRVSADCPFGTTVEVQGVSICNSFVTLNRSQTDFTATVQNTYDYSQNVTLYVSGQNNGGSTIARDSKYLQVSAKVISPEISITSPNSTQSVMRGAQLAIGWTTTYNPTYVQISLYKDNTYISTISDYAYNTGSYTWTIPGTLALGSGYKIRISDRNKNISDTSDGDITVTQDPAAAKSIVNFTVPALSLVGDINEASKTISFTVPFGTSLTSITPNISVSSGATVTPASGTAQNFTSPRVYTVTASNGSTQQYIITATTGARSSTKAITGFSFATPTATGVIQESDKTVSITVPFGTSVTALTPTITVSPNATISPSSGTAQNFTTPKTYTVTAQDGSTQTYTVTVLFGARSSAKAITGFSFENVTGGQTTINESAKTINVTVPFSTAITSLRPIIQVSPFAAVNPASGLVKNFTSPITYTVIAQDGSTVVYTVSVSIAPRSSAKDITSFRFATQNADGIIQHGTTNTISVIVPRGTDIRSLRPTITTSAFATVSSASNIARDFSSPVTYTVTAQDGTTKTYQVTVGVSTI